jgi:type VI secretion system protein ImpA
MNTDTSPRFDTEALLTPITGEEASGPWLRYTATFREIESMRINEDPSLPMGEWSRPLLRADWGAVWRRIDEVLEQDSKDLLLAAWACEARLLDAGLPGLTEGLHKLHALAAHFWETAWPRLDPSDPSARLSPFEWLNRSIPLHLRRELTLLPVTLERPERLTFAGWLALEASSNGPSTQNPTKESIRNKLSTSDTEHLERLAREFEDARKVALQIDSLLEAQLQEEKFGLSLLKAELESLGQITNSLARSGLEAHRKSTPLKANPVTDPLKPESSVQPTSDIPLAQALVTPRASELVETDIQSSNREEAYRSLEKIALRLREMDPHSPAPLLALKAARWGSMSFQEIIQTESKEGVEVANLLSFLGLNEL